jgi:hypothetical protein
VILARDDFSLFSHYFSMPTVRAMTHLPNGTTDFGQGLGKHANGAYANLRV